MLVLIERRMCEKKVVQCAAVISDRLFDRAVLTRQKLRRYNI